MIVLIISTCSLATRWADYWNFGDYYTHDHLCSTSPTYVQMTTRGLYMQQEAWAQKGRNNAWCSANMWGGVHQPEWYRGAFRGPESLTPIAIGLKGDVGGMCTSSSRGASFWARIATTYSYVVIPWYHDNAGQHFWLFLMVSVCLQWPGLSTPQVLVNHSLMSPYLANDKANFNMRMKESIPSLWVWGGRKRAPLMEWLLRKPALYTQPACTNVHPVAYDG